MSNNDGVPNGTRPSAADPIPPLEEILRKRRILITGATGFLGKALLYLLLRHHPEIERIYLLIRGDRKSSLNRFRREILDSPALAPLRTHLGARFDHYVEQRVAIVAGDIGEPDLITDGADMLGHGSLDAVIHCAGLVNFEASLEKAIAINTVGVGNVIEFCRKRGAALMHVSTCYAAGVADGHRYEDDVPVDWCPNGRRGFNLQREIGDALAACGRVEAESRDLARQAELRAAANDYAEEARDHVHESRRKQWVEERLK
ncbi:MAG TPA: SDR family oxidoreductase [Candidatus Binataceae bacterium]|nr:SDR family oxidoreductase [Candidatus Binataceae bacterium]